MIPINGRVYPSGAALTQPMFQLNVIRSPEGGDGVTYAAGVVDVLELLTVVDDVESVRVTELEDVTCDEDDEMDDMELEDTPVDDELISDEVLLEISVVELLDCEKVDSVVVEDDKLELELTSVVNSVVEELRLVVEELKSVLVTVDSEKLEVVNEDDRLEVELSSELVWLTVADVEKLSEDEVKRQLPVKVETQVCVIVDSIVTVTVVGAAQSEVDVEVDVLCVLV